MERQTPWRQDPLLAGAWVQRMRTTTRRFLLATVIAGLCDSIAFGQWQQQNIKSEADFRGLSAVSANVAWVSGTKGTYGRTTDGGKTWSVGTVPGAEKLD